MRSKNAGELLIVRGELECPLCRRLLLNEDLPVALLHFLSYDYNHDRGEGLIEEAWIDLAEQRGCTIQDPIRFPL